jgi:PTS system fructose-specific IIC component
MKLTEYLSSDQVILDLRSITKTDVLREIAGHAQKKGLVPDAQAFYNGLMERESLISTGIGDGIAIPHTRYKGPEKLFILVARSKDGVDFDSLDGDPVHLFIVIAGPESADKEQLKILSRTARLLKQAEFREKLLTLGDPSAVLACIQEEEALF